jgi:hypothetical protein
MIASPVRVEPVNEVARNGAGALHDIQDTPGDARFDGQFRQCQCAERGHFRRLEHDGVTRGERGRYLRDRLGDREIPRGDRRDHAIRFGRHHPQLIRTRGGDFTAQLVREFREKADTVGGVGNVDLDRILDRTGRCQGLQAAQRDLVGLDQIGPVPQQTGPGPGCAGRPLGGPEGVHRILNGLVDDIGIRDRQVRTDGIVARATDDKCRAAPRHQAAVDKMTVGNANCVGFEIVHEGTPLQYGYEKDRERSRRQRRNEKRHLNANADGAAVDAAGWGPERCKLCSFGIGRRSCCRGGQAIDPHGVARGSAVAPRVVDEYFLHLPVNFPELIRRAARLS